MSAPEVLTLAALAVLVGQALYAARRAVVADLGPLPALLPLVPMSQALGVGIGLVAMRGVAGAGSHRWALALGGVACAGANLLLLRMAREAAGVESAEGHARALAEQLPIQREHLANARLVAHRMDAVRAEAIAAYDQAIDRLSSGESGADGEALRAALPSVGAPRICAHPALDALLDAKRSQLAERHVTFDVRCCLPSEVGIPASTLCAVVGNLVDNAAHAVERLPDDGQRRVTVRIGIACGHVSIRIENPVASGAALPSRPRRRRLGTGVPEHGWGLGIVEELACRCGGTFAVELSGSMVVATAVLAIPRAGA